MNTATRRLWLYAALLFLPALAVGGLALGLLAREQARLAEREAVAGDARRAAVESRTLLIAENIELLVGDAQSALMATLTEAPVGEPRPFLTEWQTGNPLVQEVFRATADGLPVWGAPGGALRDWLEQAAPWRITPAAGDGFAVAAVAHVAAAPAAESEMAALGAAEVASAATVESQRRSISSNIAQYQRARQEIQEIARGKSAPQAPSAASRGQSSTRDASPASLGAVMYPPPAAGAAMIDSPYATEQMRRGDAIQVEVEMEAMPAPRDVVWRESPARVQDFDAFAAGAPSTEVMIGNGFISGFSDARHASSAPALRSGWMPWRDAEGLHLFGWRELPDGTVIGLELRLDTIKARLGEVFPVLSEPGEGYALRGVDGRAWHETGRVDLPAVVEVPLAASVLPGWAVTGHIDALWTGSVGGGGFFALGSALIGLLVFAILAAGGLLVWQARRSEQEAALKTSFVANVSHELKTPLTTIRLYADLLAQGRVREEAKRSAYLETIGQETQRLARLVGNVLDFSRLEQGKKKYEQAEFDIAAELRRLADTHAPRLAEAGLRLVAEGPDRLTVASDRDAVEQIVLNLLDNACKYAAGGGEVTLTFSSKPAGGGACVTVADRGPGVPAEQRERIFEKFHRVDDRLTAEKGGAGLGLSIARQLARGLGGDLMCRDREGGGAEFVLTIP